MNKLRACGMLVFVVVWYAIQSLESWQQMGEILPIRWIETAVWVGIGIMIWLSAYQTKDVGKKNKQKHVIIWAFNIGIVYCMVQLISGVFFGFGKSPYDRSLRGIIENTLCIGGMLWGRECIRAYVLGEICTLKKQRWAIVVIFIMTCIQIKWTRFMSISDIQSFTVFCAEYFLPKLCENLFVTYLVMYGGVKSALIYLGSILMFEWYMPILPDLKWLIKGIIGMVVPIGGTLFVIERYMIVTKKVKKHIEKENIPLLVCCAVCCVGIVWFSVGLFPIYPSVIVTGSMEPMIKPGDVIIVQKLKDREATEKLQQGDVIQFQRDNILITHRIEEVVEGEKGNTTYKTKGDNNTRADNQLVEPWEIKGELVKVIPKIGWPTLILKKQDVDREDIEF